MQSRIHLPWIISILKLPLLPSSKSPRMQISRMTEKSIWYTALKILKKDSLSPSHWSSLCTSLQLINHRQASLDLDQDVRDNYWDILNIYNSIKVEVLDYSYLLEKLTLLVFFFLNCKKFSRWYCWKVSEGISAVRYNNKRLW